MSAASGISWRKCAAQEQNTEHGTMGAVVAPTLCYLFVGLSVVKITQLFLYRIAQRTTKRDMIDYSASLAAVMVLLDLVAGEHQNMSKVPRKKFGDITDPILQKYLQKSSQRPPQRFTSLRRASEQFAKEFSGDDHPLLAHLTSQSSEVYLRLPLGLVSLLALLHFCVGGFYLFIREVFWKGGNGLTLLVKIATSTLKVVYVVSCAENIPFEQALTKYPWLDGVFSSKQLHPMIGKAVCPLYRRPVAFPKDIMDFSFEVVPVPSGTAEVRELVSGGTVRQVWHNILPCHVGAMFLVVWIVAMESGYPLGQLVLCGVAFYIVRTFCDHKMGIKWHKSYSYYP